MGYAVVDVETTGLNPATDEILEIGVITLDEAGQTLLEWSSLVKPLGGVRATFVHDLTDKDVASAPAISALFPKLRELLAGRALIAHNAVFDVGFLNNAFARARYHLRIPREATVCTMELSKIYLSAGRHSLVAAAKRAGIPVPARHRALDDAHTAAALFRYYMAAEARGHHHAPRALSRDGSLVQPANWIHASGVAGKLAWPELASDR